MVNNNSNNNKYKEICTNKQITHNTVKKATTQILT